MPLRAGNLGRVSKDKSGRVRSVSEQHAANDAEITAHGWLDAGKYEDAVSASRFATKEREDWERLVGDVDAGHLDVVVMWESSRGSRKLDVWVGFLDLCRERKIAIHVTTHRRTYDMTIRRDRKTLVNDGVENEDDSEQISEGVRRALRTNRENGLPHGIGKWGYERIHDEKTGELLGQRRVPGQAAVIAEIIRRAASGEPVSVITEDLEKRRQAGEIPAPGDGRVVRRGGPDGEPVTASGTWYRRTVYRIATSVDYLGKMRVDGELIDAKWPAISDEPDFEDVFWAAQHLLTSPARKTTRPGRAKHLLSYVMACAECGKPVSADMPRKRMVTAKYTCSNMHAHHAAVPMADADEFVTAAVKLRVRQPDVYAHLTAGSDERVIQARAEAARLRAELDEWAAADISARAFAIREAKLLPLIEAAEARATELTVPLALRELADPGADIDARWEAMTVAARRDVVRLLFAGLRLMPGRGPARDRIANGRPEEPGQLADALGA